MSYTGTVQNGHIVISPEAILPEGARVEIFVADATSDEPGPDWLHEVEKLARPRNWPQGFARSLDDHLSATHRHRS